MVISASVNSRLASLCRHACRRRRMNIQKSAVSLSQRSTSTYYDSQSGLHVPVHNDSEISMLWDLSRQPEQESFIPHQLYKEDSSSDMPDKLQELQAKGVHGLLLPPVTFPRDGRNLQTLTHVCPDGFQLFAYLAPQSADHDHVSVLLPYNHGDENDSSTDFEESLKNHVNQGSKTTFMLQLDQLIGKEPIMIANKIASLIDAHGGGDYLWMRLSRGETAEDVLQLCEELAYLDLPGATMKSRLLIDAVDEEVVEETMMLGVNKFVIDSLDMAALINEVAEDQGKTLVLRDE
jgi:hypothetical protein